MKHGDHSAPSSSLPLFATAAKARAKDPESSHEAARQATNKLRESQGAVLRVFDAHGPMSDEQLLENYALFEQRHTVPPQSPSGLRTRRHELVLLGKIVYSGQRDQSAQGKVKPRIWRLSVAEAKSA